MADLYEYAKREARRIIPNVEPFETEGRAGIATGILHLAEQLQCEDVIEAAARAMAGEDNWRIFTGFEQDGWRNDARTSLAAALAKIAEGGDPA